MKQKWFICLTYWVMQISCPFSTMSLVMGSVIFTNKEPRLKSSYEMLVSCLNWILAKTILVLSSLTFVKAFFLDFSILTLYFIWWRREEAWIKEQGQSAWTVFRSQVRGWEMPCFLEGEKKTRPLQRITASVNIPGHSWFWFWRPNIWTVIFFSCQRRVLFI